MTCQRSGRSPIIAIGLGAVVTVSCMRIPRPPQNSTTFMVCPPIRANSSVRLGRYFAHHPEVAPTCELRMVRNCGFQHALPQPVSRYLTVDPRAYECREG